MKSPGSGERGFSLIEVMVAMVIGLIAVTVIIQVAGFAEGQKRTTTGSGDAQNNAALGLYSIERDIKQAGFGINSLNILGCELVLAAPSSGTIGALAPVTINSTLVPAGEPNTDRLLIVYGNSLGSPEGDRISGGSDKNIWLKSFDNFRKGERVFIAPERASTSGKCQLIDAGDIEGFSEDTDTDSGTITGSGTGTGSGTDADSVSKIVNVSNAVTVTSNQVLFSLGTRPRIVAYAIRGDNLTTCDFAQSNCADIDNWTIVANGIVSLRAQYGHSTTASGGVDTWNQTAPANPVHKDLSCNLARVSAVRLGLVARNSGRKEAGITQSGDSDSGNNPIWMGNRDATDTDSIPFDPDYRYQVYETVVPIRNIPWMDACGGTTTDTGSGTTDTGSGGTGE
jgi:type IV pilus assembly protein PilW